MFRNGKTEMLEFLSWCGGYDEEKFEKAKNITSITGGYCLIVRRNRTVCPPQCAFAADIQTQPDGGAHYINVGSTVTGQDTFLDLEKGTSISNSVINEYKTFRLGNSNFFSVVSKRDGTTSTVKIVDPMFNFNKFLADDISAPSDANAVAIKLRNSDGEYYYKVLGTKDKGFGYKAATNPATGVLLSQLVGMQTSAAQSEIYGYLKNGENEKVKEWMTKYLPCLCYVQIDAADLEKIENYIDSSSSEGNSQLNNYLQNDQYVLSGDDIAIKGSIETQWNLLCSGEPTDSPTTYSYSNKKIESNASWRPMDRAIYKVTVSDQYKLENKYWVTGSGQGAIPAKDSTSGKFPTTNGTGTTTDNGVGKDEQGEENKEVIANTSSTGIFTAITVDKLETGAGSIIDLSYLNTNNDDGIPLVLQTENNKLDVSFEDHDQNNILARIQLNRALIVNDATMGQNTTFRLGVYSDGDSRTNDTVRITNAEQHDEDSNGKTNLNIQLGWVPEIKEGSAGGSWTPSEKNIERQVAQNTLLGIYNGADKFTVTAQQSEIDGVFGTYLLLPEIGQYDDYYNTGVEGDKQGTAWYLKGYTYADTGELSESGKSVSENSTVQNNFVKANNLSLFRRSENLHGGRLNRQEAGGNGPQHDESGLAGELRENLWADVWHGKFDAKAAYARSTNQSYNGFQVGYDKLLSKKFYGGKVYTGFYASKIDGKSTTAAGKGEQDSYGVGVYSSWVGDKGHFIDLGVNAFKLKNDYHFTGNTGNGSIGKVKGDNSTWAYGIGAQYGKRNELSSNWFWEPSVSLYVGHVDESNYKLTNGLGIHEQGYDTAIGKLGLKAGKNIGDKGNLYAGVSWGHEFAGGQKLHQSYGPLNRLVETVGGSDSWWEWNVGGKVKLSPNAALNLDFIKTTGSDVGNEWSINGGLDFSWGGFGSGGSKAAKVNASGGEPSVSGGGFAKANAPTVVVGQAPKVGNVQVPQMQQSVAVESGSADSRAVYDMDEAGSSVVRDDTGSVSGTVTGGMGEFELGGLTVEAKRPDWEKNLSPGQVSVIYTKEFEGEQKDLPTLLQRVPGMYIQRVSGLGHYTVARTRGSSASQVNVYVDGVLMNLNGESAVNLSAIPVDNVERIEVYRGYVPARFSGAPLGGAINIVTKKPTEGTGHITQGVKSYGGYSSTYEYSMPLGSGSLLATYARDIWQGDFPYVYKGATTTPEYNNKRYNRQSNGYQNNNAMLKWQDDNWTVKAVYKKLHEQLPANLTSLNSWSGSGGNGTWWEEQHGYTASTQDIDYKEFSVGQRDTSGNLDWGWRADYLHSKKTYRNTGGYKIMEDRPFVSENDFLPGRLWSEYVSKKWNGNMNLAMKMGSNHLLEFNGDFSRETMNCDGNRWWLSDAESKPNDSGLRERKMLNKYSINEYHFTLQDTITLNDDGDLKLTPIFRGDKVEMETMGSNDQRWKWSGGVALQKQINDQWSFKTTWGTYNRHPNFYEIFGDGGYTRPNKATADFYDLDNGDVWESGKQFDFSLNWQGKLAKADTSTILTWFQRDAKNQIVMSMPMGAGSDVLAQYFNMDKVDVHGIELSHNMQWRRLGLNLAATWQKSEAKTRPSTGSWLSSPVSLTPEWVVSARLDYLFPGDKLNVFAEYNYTDEFITNAFRDNRGYVRELGIRSYSTVDIGLKYKFDKNWKLSAGVNDVFNKGYDVMGYEYSSGNGGSNYNGRYCNLPCPLAGRMYYTTLEYSF